MNDGCCTPACVLSLIGVAAHNGAVSAWTVGVYDAPTSLKLSMATAGLSAATNFFSTLLISWKAWWAPFLPSSSVFFFQHFSHQVSFRQRRDLFKTQTSSTSGSSARAHKIMSLLIESGFIYFGIWVHTYVRIIRQLLTHIIIDQVVAMLNFYLDWKAPVLQAVLRGGYDMVMVRIASHEGLSGSPLRQGTYPTLIIILVHMDYTFWDTTHTESGTKITLGSRGFNTVQPSIASAGVLSPTKDMESRW
jgi:hypothetical protein